MFEKSIQNIKSLGDCGSNIGNVKLKVGFPSKTQITPENHDPLTLILFKFLTHIHIFL